MKNLCGLCNGQLLEITGPYEVNSKALGIVKVPEVHRFQCSECGDVTLPSEEAGKVSHFTANKVEETIKLLPIGQFIPADQAANILGVSKQAFSKNKRIKRGFIYFTELGNSKVYFEPSVEAFAANNDGRISLVNYLAKKSSLSQEWEQSASFTTIKMMPATGEKVSTRIVQVEPRAVVGVSEVVMVVDRTSADFDFVVKESGVRGAEKLRFNRDLCNQG